MKISEEDIPSIMEKLSELETDVWQSEFEVIDEEGDFRLLHYRPLSEERYETPLLMVYAFINRPFVLDMAPDISVVRKFLQAGLDVYMIDWGYPTGAGKYLEIADYINYIDRSVEIIKEREDTDKVSLHGYCLGGTLSVIYTTLHQEKVKNLLLQATPIDFHTDNVLAKWARKLPVDEIVDAYGCAPGEFLKMGFLLADPISLIVGRYEMIPDMMEEGEMMENFLRMERWIFDTPSIPGEVYRTHIKEWYQENSIIKGEFEVEGEKVDLGRIEVPLLLVGAEYDTIAPPESQRVIWDMVSSEDKKEIEMGKGHVGMTVSSECHEKDWPRVVEWLEERSGEKR